MPEKTMENNTRTMPERPEDTPRRYMREAENTVRDAMSTWNDMIPTTTNFYFDIIGKTMHHNMELTKHTQDAWENMMTVWRRMYTDNYKAWEGYWDEMNKM